MVMSHKRAFGSSAPKKEDTAIKYDDPLSGTTFCPLPLDRLVQNGFEGHRVPTYVPALTWGCPLYLRRSIGTKPEKKESKQHPTSGNPWNPGPDEYKINPNFKG